MHYWAEETTTLAIAVLFSIIIGPAFEFAYSGVDTSSLEADSYVQEEYKAGLDVVERYGLDTKDPLATGDKMMQEAVLQES